MNNEAIINAFIDGVEKLYAQDISGQDGFSSEFQKIKQHSSTLKQNPNYRCTTGELVENKKRNRYKDILPFDYSRVILPTLEDASSDYINASFIEGPEGKRCYIASQGPLPHTVNDFWRMLWTYNVKVVVMVCREIELGKKKCERYWPADQAETKTFGDITVSLLSSADLGNGICKRCMYAERGKESHEVIQLHYKTWPDHGTPRGKEEILSLIDAARNMQAYSVDASTPLCVHCSAGCGRTGAVLVIDYFRYLLYEKKLTSNISVYDVIIKMRRQRPAIVQTKEQYEFVHLAISQLFTKYILNSGKKVSSNFSRSLMSTNYENITLPESSKLQKAPKPSETRKMSVPRNNYENISLEIPPNAQRHSLAGNLPLKPQNPPPKPVNLPPKPLNPPPPLKQNRAEENPVATSEKQDYRVNNQSVNNTKSKPSKFSPELKASKPIVTTQIYSHNPVESDVQSTYPSALNQKPSPVKSSKPSPVSPKPKPRPRSTQSNLSNTEGTASPVQTPKSSHEIPKFVITESIQARMEKLRAHGWRNDTPSLQQKSEVSASVSDLRFINNYSPSIARRRFVRAVSADLDDCNNSNNNNNVAIKPEKNEHIQTNKGISKKPLMPPLKGKPPALPKKTGSIKVTTTSKELLTTVSSSNEIKPNYINTSKTDIKPTTTSYVNVTSTVSVDKSKNSYEHITRMKNDLDTYDIFKRSTKSTSNVEKETGNTETSSSQRASETAASYSTVNVNETPPASSTVEIGFRSVCSSTSSSVFETSPTTKESAGQIWIQDQTKNVSVNSSKPPMKPKRTFKRSHNPYLQKAHSEDSSVSTEDLDILAVDQYSLANHNGYTADAYSDSKKSMDLYSQADSLPAENMKITITEYSYGNDIKEDINPYAEVGDVNDLNYTALSRQRGHSCSSQRSSSSYSNDAGSQSFSNISTSSNPPLPQRTPESYILEGSDNSYEDLNVERKSSFSSDHRPSGLAGVKAKAKGMIGKTSNVFHHLTTNSKDETHQSKPRHKNYTQEPVIWRNQDISYGNRVQKKPKGPRPVPERR